MKVTNRMVRRAEFESATSSVSTTRSNRAELTAHKLATTKTDSDNNPFRVPANSNRALRCQSSYQPFAINATTRKLLKISVSFEPRVSQILTFRQSSRQIKTPQTPICIDWVSTPHGEFARLNYPEVSA
jgi:hypothetical protein